MGFSVHKVPGFMFTLVLPGGFLNYLTFITSKIINTTTIGEEKAL